MEFEISERIQTSASKEVILAGLEEQFKKVSKSVQRSGESLMVKSITTFFESIDTTTVEIRVADDGYLILANVDFRPSGVFWIEFILLIFTGVFWLVPMVFYMYQKNTVQTCIKEAFTRIKNEYMR